MCGAPGISTMLACLWLRSAAPQCPAAAGLPTQLLAGEKNGSVELVERELFMMPRRRDRPPSLAARAFEDAVVRHLPQAALRPEVTLSD